MFRIFVFLIVVCSSVTAQDWSELSVPVDLGIGKGWQLQPFVSDDFNYTSKAEIKSSDFNAKWTDFYHNAWTGPKPTVWKRNHVSVKDGKLNIITSRPTGSTETNTGCITSKIRVQYPVYVEAKVKITNSVLASNVWMLSPDDTQEIDIVEAYGGDRSGNEWFRARVHLSHHVFIRSPFQDYQPTDPGTWYTDGKTDWPKNFHRFGVYWRDPWHLEYYIDGKLVRTVSGKSIIDPLNYTNGTGLNKEMDIIINMEDQTWRADQGLTPTNEELKNEIDNTFLVDWIRVYKPTDVVLSVEKPTETKVQISPNPFTDSIYIESESKIKQVKLLQSNGVILQTVQIDDVKKLIPIKGISAGTYLIQIEFQNGSQETKTVMKR